LGTTTSGEGIYSNPGENNSETGKRRSWDTRPHQSPS